MRGWVQAFLLAALAVTSVLGWEDKLDQDEENRQRCAGMYSKSAWGGPVDPFILLKFTDMGKDLGDDPVVSLVIFEWNDEDFIGVLPDPESHQKVGICEPRAVQAGYCNETDIGAFILAPDAAEKSVNPIYTAAIHLKENSPINYPIKRTGYYCVLTDAYSATGYLAIVEFRNAYGELPATQIPKLPFYGGITILYALVLVFWGLLCFQHRSDILAVQNYITAILIFLVVEMLITWGFYDYMNRNGSTIGSKILLVTVAVLNAARNSFSFFLLLIVCMGYGVVKTTLGRTMVWVRWLAIAHFIFGIVYAVASLLISPESAGPLVLLVVLPLASTLTAFYMWTLNSLNMTLKDLRQRKQHAKEAMYRKLWWCILISIVVIFLFFLFNSFSFVEAHDRDFAPFHWKSRWFILDGWLNLVYFADVAFIAYVWRPTANNRRFAMSDEIAQDDDGTFEIHNLDIGAPEEDDDDDDDDDVEAAKHLRKRSATAAGASASAAVATGASVVASSSSSAGTQRPTPPKDDDSLDGDTIFAVGDKFSDDEDSDGDATDEGNNRNNKKDEAKAHDKDKKDKGDEDGDEDGDDEDDDGSSSEESSDEDSDGDSDESGEESRLTKKMAGARGSGK